MLRNLLKKVLTGAIILTGLCIIAVFIIFRIYSKNPEKLVKHIATKADISLNNIHHIATKQGKKQWELDAQSAEYIKKNDITLLNKISVVFYLKNDEKIFLKAAKGYLKVNSNDLEIKGQVSLNYNEYNMTTDSLLYSEQTRTILTKSPVSIKGNLFSLSGDFMSFDINNKKIVIEKNVVGIYRGKDI